MEDSKTEEPSIQLTSSTEDNGRTGGTSEEQTYGEGEGQASPQAHADEAALLKGLAATARDQDDLEKAIGQQADQLLIEQANERDQKRLEKTVAQKEYGR